MSKKHTVPQFEFASASAVFNLTGEVMRQPEPRPQPRQDLTALLPLDAESQLRELLERKGVHPVIQSRVIADATAKAAPGYMARFFPPIQPAKKYAARNGVSA